MRDIIMHPTGVFGGFNNQKLFYGTSPSGVRYVTFVTHYPGTLNGDHAWHSICYTWDHAEVTHSHVVLRRLNVAGDPEGVHIFIPCECVYLPANKGMAIALKAINKLREIQHAQHSHASVEHVRRPFRQAV